MNVNKHADSHVDSNWLHDDDDDDLVAYSNLRAKIRDFYDNLDLFSKVSSSH